MKILVTADTFAASKDGAEFLPANSLQDLDTDAARAIVHAGKALYIDPKDDPSRIKTNVAPEARVEAVRAAIKAAAKAQRADAPQ